MAQNILTKAEYDFRQYDRVWQRVAPALSPWGVTRQNETQNQDAQQNQPGQQNISANPAIPGNPAECTNPVPPAAVVTDTDKMSAVQGTNSVSAAVQNNGNASTAAQNNGNASAAAQNNGNASAAVQNPTETLSMEAVLPGAEINPCCMGTEAQEDLTVLNGFVEEELSQRRQFQALLQRAPIWARQTLRELANGCFSRAKNLMAVHYLITGRVYEPAVRVEGVKIGRWCPELRERYHAMACTALNYARAAEGSADPCLTRLLEDLSAAAYAHASEILRLLERSIVT